MNCKYVQSHIQQYIDQAIDSPHAEAIGRHISQCNVCKHEYQSYTKLISLLKTTDYPRLKEEEWQNIHKKVMNTISSLPQKKKIVSISFFSLFDASSIPLRALAALFVIGLISLAVFVIPGRLHIGKSSVTIVKEESYPRVVALNGNVYTLQESNGQSLSKDTVKGDVVLQPGKLLETDLNASAHIKVDNNSVIKVGQHSRFIIKDCASNKMIVKLTNGDMAASIGKRSQDQLFRVETPNAFCEVIGTRFNIATQHDDFRDRYITTLRVEEGTVKFGCEKSQVFITEGSAIAVFGDSLGIPTSIDDPLINQLTKEPGRGIFTITSTPSEALVLIDGIPSGFTPLYGSAPFGVHTVILIKKGFIRSRNTIVINAHQKAEMNIVLKQGFQPSTDSATVLASGSTLDNQLLIKATEQMIAGNYEEALEPLEKLINNENISPDIKAAAIYKAVTCNKYLNRYSVAVDLLKQLIEGNYSDDIRSNALFERASIYKNLLYDIPKASADFRNYTRNFKDGIWAEEALYSLAELLLQLQEYSEAAQIYKNYCDTYKKTDRTENSLYKLGIIYVNNLSEPQKALQTFNRLILEFPDTRFYEDAVFWSADCLLRLGLANRAIREFNAYIKRYPQGKWLTEVKRRLQKIETAEAR